MVKSPSDRPRDLNQRREEFLRSFVRRGVELTEELLVENRGLQERLTMLEEENARMRAQLASDDAIRELLQKIETLERERMSLLSRSHQLERDGTQREQRYGELERDLNELATLYVAGDQLASQLEPRRVLRSIRDLLEQFVGVKSFVLYRVTPTGGEAVPILTHGPAALAAGVLALIEGPVADGCLTGNTRIMESLGSAKGPLAVVPLVVADEVLAVIVVLELLPHKQRWEQVDHELFKLLSRRAPVSLLAAAGQSPKTSPRASLAVFEGVLQSESSAERSE